MRQPTTLATNAYTQAHAQDAAAEAASNLIWEKRDEHHSILAYNVPMSICRPTITAHRRTHYKCTTRVVAATLLLRRCGYGT